MDERRARWRTASLGLVVVGVLLVFLAKQMDGSSNPGAPLEADSTTSKTQDPPMSSIAATASALCLEADLSRCLMAAPAGSRPWPHPFVPNGPVSVEQFVTHFYPPDRRLYVTGRLDAEGVQSIVHEDWEATNGDEADVVLIKFATGDGAQSALLQEKAGRSNDPQQKVLALPDTASSVVSFFRPAEDDQGNIRGYVTAQVGRVVAEIYFFSPARLDQPTLSDWVRQQITALTGKTG